MDIERLYQRVKVHAALADPHRLAIVDDVALSDRAPSELATMLSINSNLLAHHLATMESAGLIERVVSQGDRRRRYVRLTAAALDLMTPSATRKVAQRVIFVCTENAARSQLAQGIWNQSQPIKAISGGTQPAERLYPGTISAAARRGIDLTDERPRPLPELGPLDLVVTVCDRAHEILQARQGLRQLHWSISDPAISSRADSFDVAADDLARHIRVLGSRVTPVVKGAVASQARESDEDP